MNAPQHPTTDTPGLRRAGFALAAAASMALCAGQALARDVTPAPEPTVVPVELDTDSLYWDLCVGHDREEAANELANAIVRGMDDPDALYVIDLPQLTREWKSVDASNLTGLDGERINRRRLAMYRGGYEARVERALLSVLRDVQKQRPGVRVSVQDFRPMPQRNQRGDAYDDLSGSFTFVTLSEEVDFRSTREFDRWLDDMNIDNEMPALVRTPDGWVFAGDDALLDGLSEPLEDAYVSAWPDDEPELDGSLSEDTVKPASAGEGDDDGPSNRLSFGPEGAGEGYRPGQTAIDNGMRRLTGVEMRDHEDFRRKLEANRDQGDDNQPDEEGPGDNGRPDGPNETEGQGEVDPPESEGSGETQPDESEPASGSPLLIPGPGFNGPTSAPSVFGNPNADGGDARAIARWDVVPYQTITGNFDIGVVAFHYGGIEKVDFSLNGGPWTSVYEPTLNERTGVVEYTARLDAATLDDGAFEVRAIVYPQNGVPRVLGGEMDWDNEYLGAQWCGEHSLFMFSNAGGTSSEVVVELPSGTYAWGDLPNVPSNVPNDRWLVIQPAPGADVTITPGVWHPQPHMIRLHDINLVQPSRQATLRGSADDLVWFDGVDYTGPGMWERTDSMKIMHSFWTNSTVRESQYGHAEHFIRGCTFERIGEDTLKRTYMVLNTDIDNQGNPPAHLTWHPAVIANPIVHDNRIYYGLDIVTRQKAWAFRNGTHEQWEHTDVAIVECTTLKTTQGNQLFYIGGTANHVLIQDSSFLGDGSFNYRLSNNLTNPEWRFNPHNVMMRNNNWWNDPSWMPNPTPLEGVTIEQIGR